MSTVEPIDIFIAYAKADTPLLERLRTQLSAAERVGLVDAWHDGEIEVGSDRVKTTQAAMQQAEVILLLLSADFFASEYLYEKEMPQALALAKAGKATVIPVLLKDCTWQLSPLANFPALPKNNIPVTNKHWTSPDQALKKVVDEVIQISNQIRQKGGAQPINYPAPPDENTTDTKTITKTIEKTNPKPGPSNTSLIRNAVIALGLLALISFAVNRVFFSPSPPSDGTTTTPPPHTPTPPQQEGKKEQSGTMPQMDFPSISLNSLTWMTKNLDLAVENSFCYDDEDSNCLQYGRLYDFETAQTICPQGWRLPTRQDWAALSTEQFEQLGLSRGGVYRNKAFRELNTKGFYWTSERAAGGQAWVFESRNDSWYKEQRFSHWYLSCRCVQ